MKIGECYKLLKPFKPGKATIVDLLPANIVPPADKIDKYYSWKVGEKIYGSVYKGIKVDRWILQRANGSYIILPSTASYMVQLDKSIHPK